MLIASTAYMSEASIVKLLGPKHTSTTNGLLESFPKCVWGQQGCLAWLLLGTIFLHFDLIVG